MTLLSIVQSVAPRIGVPKPSSVIGSQDLQVQQLKAFVDEAGIHLARYHDWQSLIIVASQTADGTQILPNTLPADYDRLIYNCRMWNSTRNLPVLRASQKRWRFLLQYSGNSGLGGFYRILQGKIHILPNIISGNVITFEYISKNWSTSSVSALGQASFSADADTTIFDEEIMALETIWRYRKAKGLAQYAEDMATAEREKEKIAAADRSSTNLDREPAPDDPPPTPYWQGSIG